MLDEPQVQRWTDTAVLASYGCPSTKYYPYPAARSRRIHPWEERRASPVVVARHQFPALAAAPVYPGRQGDMICSSGAYDAGTFHAVMACVLAWPLFFAEASRPPDRSL
jgi:hypothetical protein